MADGEFLPHTNLPIVEIEFDEMDNLPVPIEQHEVPAELVIPPLHREGQDGDNRFDFDAQQFIRDGNDIRFQLPSNNLELTMSRYLNGEGSRGAATIHPTKSIRRRKTIIGTVRRRSIKSPSVALPTKPNFLASTDTAKYDEVDRFTDTDVLMSVSQQFEELQNIKSLTLPMEQKRLYRDQLQKCVCVDESGLTMARYSVTKRWLKMTNKVSEASNTLDLWRGTLKEIEGQFGAGIMEYFKLVKWMIVLNFILFLVSLFIVVPQLAIAPYTYQNTFHNYTSALDLAESRLNTNSSLLHNFTRPESVTTAGPAQAYTEPQVSRMDDVVHDYLSAVHCTAEYVNHTRMVQETDVLQRVLDFFQGTGSFEITPLFYGYYFNKTSNIRPESPRPDQRVHSWFNLSVAYLLIIMVFFIVSLLFIVVSTSRGLTQNMFTQDLLHYRFINKVFAGWDYGLYKERSARIKRSLVKHEIMRDLAEERRACEIRNRTWCQKLSLTALRICVNFIIITILLGCGFAIYFAQLEATKRLEGQLPPFETLVWQYMPSVLITVMYALFPLIFNRLAKFEKYSPANELNITILRIVLLRLASLALLLTPVFVEIITCDRSNSCDCDGIYCWETFIGQQMYKLVLLDFLVIVGVTFIVEFPRKLMWKRWSDNRLIAAIGQEEFDIPVNVIDVIYTQTLCWIGAFYSPLIPIITFLKVLIFFYVKKLSLFHNQKPSATPYRASSIDLFFMVVLTFSFLLGILTVGISVGVIEPSRSCGPFRTYSTIETPYTMFGAISEALLTSSHTLREIIGFLASSFVQVALIVVLCLLIYFYSAKSNGQTRLLELLRDTLMQEERDKNWLLSKVNDALRQDLAPAVRSSDQPRR